MKGIILSAVWQVSRQMSTGQNQLRSDGCMDGRWYITKMDKCIMQKCCFSQ